MQARQDASYIRRAIELADLDAVRVTLYQLTEAPGLRDLPMASDLDEPQREQLIEEAVAWLVDNQGPGRLPEPPEEKLRELLDLATREKTADLEFEARRDLPAFKDFPWAARWTSTQPTLPPDFRVAIIGGGFSGIAMGVQLEQLGIPYVVLERQEDPGGTWSVNRYPDIRVDTSSLAYDFSFEKDYRWSEYYGRGAEVRAYLEYVARKHGVLENMRFGRELQNARFDEANSRWTLELMGPEGPETLDASVVVTAVGTFLNPRHVHFEGAASFEGSILHPARWPENYDAAGRRVAVIGNGSTGVQLLAPIAREAAQVFVFQRTPQWISPRPRYGDAVEPEVRWLTDNFPGYWNWARYMASARVFETHDLLLPDEEWQAQGGGINKLQDDMRNLLLGYIETETGGRQDLIDRLVPTYLPFARRAVVDNSWYRSLTRDNVELVSEEIERFTPEGIETVDGTVREVDTIITATGFEVSNYLAPISFRGRGGQDLHDFWSKDGPRAYISLMVPRFPNFFMLYGPNSQPVSGGTMLPGWFVMWASYVGQCLVRTLEQGARCVEVKEEAYERYNADLDAEGKKLVLLRQEAAPEKNYYINSEHSRLQVSSPWYGPEFQRMSTRVDWNDLTIS